VASNRAPPPGFQNRGGGGRRDAEITVCEPGITGISCVQAKANRRDATLSSRDATPGDVTEKVQVEGLRLAVRSRAAAAEGPAARRGLVLLHGWPGTRDDWGLVFERLAADANWTETMLVCPDLRGYGESDRPAVDLISDEPYAAYTPAAHAHDIIRLIEHYRLEQVLIGGYDIGANVAQALARQLGDQVRGLVLCDPVHAAARAQAGQVNLSAELWYQALHLQPWAGQLIAHDRATVEVYLRHFYTHWWGSGEVEEQHFQAVVDAYSQPGAFDASIGWYRSRARSRGAEARAAASARLIATPTEILWGEQDPITPVLFAESLDQSFSDFRLTRLAEAGHFAPLEASMAVAAAFVALADRVGW
jgi:pimeloyl-ACP methyl ester carboxylesterase